MFEGFTSTVVDTGEVRLRVRHGGEGPPIVLLHGHPRTHVTWSRVAPRLVAAGHTVICPDLRGYGRSTLPPDEPGHAQSSKRAMARDVIALLDHLGHERATVVGHDRGSNAAFRTAMDHPDRVSRLVVMDGVPVLEALERTDWRFARDWWHWWFLAQTEKPAERVICADPDAWYRTPGPEVLGEEEHADVVAALRDPAVVHGMCEDYRAGLESSREQDEADRAAGRQVRCPVLVTWATRDDMERIYGEVLAVWRPWVAGRLEGVGIDAGHHQAEDAPAAVADAIAAFAAS
jgi:haloacetate dehalogenase